jgi:ATP-binding cassette, subfamily A (ABC1), member 3
MYEDQIFVMLGHNGAGKSSSISILTGLYEPSTYEQLEVFGLDLCEDSENARQSIGVCP